MSQPIIELEAISRNFGTFQALNELSLSLQPGLIGLLGPNGAGKSTLLKIIMGLLEPSSGKGRVLDQTLGGDRDAANNWQLRRLIGFMPEADALVPGLTGIDYVGLAGELTGMPRREAKRRAHEVLSYLQLEEARYRNVEEYSAGMKQRVKLAQALIHDPPVLLLDEPTSGLDPSGRDAMLNLIRELGSDHGKSIILSTHLLADVQAVCEQVVIITSGTVKGVGSVAQLCAQRDNRFKLKLQGESKGFRDDLQNEGVDLVSHTPHGELKVKVPEGWSNMLFFKLAAMNGVTIRSLTRDDESLEELFMRSVN